MMISSKKLILATAISVILAGCVDNGEDGAAFVPTTQTSQSTQLHYIGHEYVDGQVIVDFDVTDENGDRINGLTSASLYLADYVEIGEDEFGVVLSRNGKIGGRVFVGTYERDQPTEGASLTEVSDGRYQLIAPIATVHAGTEAIVRLQVGAGKEDEGIAASPYVIIDTPDSDLGVYTTDTKSCYACHVDYATSDMEHPYNVAYDINGEVDFIAGCMVCHNSVRRDVAEDGTPLDTGGYARSKMYDLGHKVHSTDHMNEEWAEAHPDFELDPNWSDDDKKEAIEAFIAAEKSKQFTTGFSFSDCSTCHSSGYFSDQNYDEPMKSRQTLRDSYKVELGTPYYDATVTYTNADGAQTGGYCVDISLFDTTAEPHQQVDIAQGYADGEGKFISYAGAYLTAYDPDHGSILKRVNGFNKQGYVNKPDGSRGVCYPALDLGTETYTHINASSRVTLMEEGWVDDKEARSGVSFTNYSDGVTLTGSAEPYTLGTEERAYQRRHIVTGDSCTTCHNNEANYHKNGSFQDGGRDCLACHNNGFDRSSGNSAPGLGPMIHSMHWGKGNLVNEHGTDEDGNKLPNSAAALSAANCVSCHENGIDLHGVPNNYMLSKAFNGGTNGVASSPITANCYACHNSDAALSHMVDYGGEINTPVTELGVWFEAPTEESCAVCHAEGRSYGIDQAHNFSRVTE